MVESPHVGTLFVVATPIGNLGDMSARCIDTLRRVAVIAAEDTRRTARLVEEVGSEARLESFHAHSTSRKSGRLLEILLAGKSVALVTDAGTPGVSDPGAELVAGAREVGIPVVPIPGASAVTAAISVSGFGADRYYFVGFLPRKGRARRTLLREMGDSTCTSVLFESPHRLIGTLEEMQAILEPGRRIMVAREISKMYEDYRTGTPEELAVYYAGEPVRGEVTMVVEGGSGPDVAIDPELLAQRAGELLAEGMTRKDAAAQLAAEFGIARNEAYRTVTGL